MLCDKHVVKMILESAQLLCNAHWVTGNGPAPYAQTHVNHPCSIWVRSSISNYKWLLEHAFALCEEYTIRYNKKHKTTEVIAWCSKNLPKLKNIGLTEFAQAMPDQYRDIDAVVAYRKYYVNEKSKIAKYKLGIIPDFMIGVLT